MNRSNFNPYKVPECRVERLCEVRMICTSGVTIPGNMDETTLFDED